MGDGMKKNKALFGDIASEVGRSDTAHDAHDTSRKRPGYLLDRSNRLAETARGDAVEKTLLLVDPKRCRLWKQHNRRYELLNEQRCADLIEGIKAQGKQEFPAIVRRVNDESGYEWEVICGARRHWAVSWLREHNYPEYKFLIEERDLTDEQAFRLADVENRDREDISDFERAEDYKYALNRYYDTQKQMAERLEMTPAWLSLYLDLADLPAEIVNAYADVTQIKVQHGRDLKPLLKDPRSRALVLAKAVELQELRKQAIESGNTCLDGQQVVRLLKSASHTAKKAKGRGGIGEYKSASGNTLLLVTKKGRSGLVMQVVPNSGATLDEVREACSKALQECLKWNN